MRKLILTLHNQQIGERSFTLYKCNKPFLVPRFKHVMMGHSLIEIDFPEDYYNTNTEALESMSFNTNLYIKQLQDDI
jgi:hypothetical protein